MNINRIRQATVDIEYYERAVKWLEEYGERAIDKTEVSIRTNEASACTGYSEAIRTLESYVRFSLPEVLETAIRSCYNTIEMAQDAIREEATKE